MAFGVTQTSTDPTTINSIINELANMQYSSPDKMQQAQSLINQLRGGGTPDPYVLQGAVNLLANNGSKNVTPGPSGMTYTGQPTVSTGGGGTGGATVTPPPAPPAGPATPPPFSIDPNQPLSTPGTPINQGTAPSDINSFIPATSTQQQNIVNQALDQSRSTANQNVGDLNDLFHKNILAQVSNWTDPNSPDYQSTMGQLNNVGRADPNTFGQSLSSRLAPLISNSLTQTAQGALLPSFLTQQGLIGTGAANQSNIGLASLQRFMQQADFQKQSDLANQLADKGVPSNFQQGVGGASSFLQGLGNFGQGAAGLKSLTNTWICTHLKKLKLTTEEEVDAVHQRLCPTLVRHPIHWLHYLLYGPRLIALADAGGADWGEVKQVLIDAVIAEPDSEKAFLIYRDGCKRLCERYAPELWNLEVLA